MKKTKSESVLDSTARLRRAARERADDEARRIPWQQLYDARNQYIDWQEYYLWVRSILEAEGRIPDWLAGILQNRCPGFLESEKAFTSKAGQKRPLTLRMEDWIDDNIFDFAKRGGWFFAVTYYAVRDPRYQRAAVCWSECVERWKEAKPIRYPSFEEWKALGEQCDETAHLVAGERQSRASAKLVAPGRLPEAVARYIDYEALAYWARPALEDGSELPPEVVRELERRCPAYLQAAPEPLTRKQSGAARDWEHLMLWIADRFFQDAKAEGWFAAILVQVRNHPRANRTMEFADHCSELWGSELPIPYPFFEDWRRDADSYVVLDD